MNDDSSFGSDPEPLDIDDRSPAERWTECGRAGFERVRSMIEEAHLDTAALAWMILVLALTAAQAYSAVRASGFSDAPGFSSDWWLKAQLLAQTGGMFLIFGSVIGTALAALAALAESSRARLALRLAVAGGAWVVFCGILGVVTAVHSSDNFSLLNGGGTEGKIVGAVNYLCIGGLGALVALIAGRLDPETEIG